jgi:hypothetical protein
MFHVLLCNVSYVAYKVSHMLPEILITIMFNALCEFIYENLLKQINFVKTKVIVQSVLYNVGSKIDSISKSNMFKFEL